MSGTQSEIFSKYRSLFNGNSINPTESPTSKRIDNLDFIDFLFEIVKSTKSQKDFKNIILKGSLSELKQTDQINSIFKNAFISKFSCDNNLIIPGKYTTESVSGIEMSKTELDAFGMFKTNPDSQLGSYIYEGNDITKHVNFLLYKAQTSNSNSPYTYSYNGKDLFTIYAKDSNTFIFKFGLYYKNKKYSEWLNDYLSATAPAFNFVNFTAILTDLITGAISLSGNKTANEVNQQSTIIAAMQKIFGFCNENSTNSSTNGSPSSYLNNTNAINTNSTSNGSDTINNGTTSIGDSNNTTNTNNNNNSDPFNFTNDELSNINKDVDVRSKGFIRFSTCGDLDVPINPEDILFGLNGLFNNSNSSGLIDYSNTSKKINNSGDAQIDTTTNGIYDNSTKNPNLDKTTDFFDTALKNGVNQVVNDGENTAVINFPNMNAEMQLNILKAIPYALMEMIISPRTLIIPKTYAVLTGKNSKSTIQDIIRSLSSVIEEMGGNITSLIVKNIFNSIKSDLIRLGKDLALGFLKQRGLDYISCLTSILSLLGIFNGSNSNCGSVLDLLLKLLKLANFGPMPMIPPPLVLVSGALKPGLNHVSMINDVKSSLDEKGIVTAPTMPDGSPNHMMIAIEETIKTITSHIKTNAQISVSTVGVGFSQGFGQIQ